ncbi:MAG: hypothetical protein WKF35_05735 [Ferruginibacter sp.]
MSIPKKSDLTESGNDISPVERDLLDDSMDNSLTEDNINLKRSALDNTDNDGELLNEGSMADDISGEDLDVPGSEDDDENEMLGEEDEENNSYSQADTE